MKFLFILSLLAFSKTLAKPYVPVASPINLLPIMDRVDNMDVREFLNAVMHCGRAGWLSMKEDAFVEVYCECFIFDLLNKYSVESINAWKVKEMKIATDPIHKKCEAKAEEFIQR